MPFFEVILILSAVVSLATLVVAALAAAREGVFRPLSDGVSVVQMVLIGLAAIYIYRLGQSNSFLLALFAFLIGLGGALVIAILQALLVLRTVSFDATFLAVLAAGVAVGVWLILGSVAVAMSVVIPPGILYVAVIAGIGYILPLAGYRLGGQRHPLFWVGSVLGVAGYAVWAIWLVQAV